MCNPWTPLASSLPGVPVVRSGSVLGFGSSFPWSTFIHGSFMIFSKISLLLKLRMRDFLSMLSTPWTCKIEYGIFCPILASASSWNSVHQKVGTFWGVCIGWLLRFTQLPGVYPTFGLGRVLGKHKKLAVKGVQLPAKGEFLAENKICNLDIHVSIQEQIFCLWVSINNKLLMTALHSRLYSGIWLAPFSFLLPWVARYSNTFPQSLSLQVISLCWDDSKP